VSDEEHPAVDRTDGIEMQLASGVEVVRLDRNRHSREARAPVRID
jgi:hypothetical protein